MEDSTNYDSNEIRLKFISNYIKVKELGKGSTGETILVKDPTLDFYYAMKKFKTSHTDMIEELYQRFITEIKILFQLQHPNVVRFNNFYLYEKEFAGIIQMEFVDGNNIREFRELNSTYIWNSIFTTLISTFDYLEKNKVMHRDIRVQNILIDKNEKVKIIDFGFSKINQATLSEPNSVCYLNWIAEIPDELLPENGGNYSNQTDIYFLGNLLLSLKLNECDDFRYNGIISKMSLKDPNMRFKTFEEIVIEIENYKLQNITFSDADKKVYQKFADLISQIIVHHIDDCNLIQDNDVIIENLESINRISTLEDIIANNNDILNAFLSSGFRYKKDVSFYKQDLYNFLKRYKLQNDENKEIMLSGIKARLRYVKTVYESVPF